MGWAMVWKLVCYFKPCPAEWFPLTALLASAGNTMPWQAGQRGTNSKVQSSKVMFDGACCCKILECLNVIKMWMAGLTWNHESFEHACTKALKSMHDTWSHQWCLMGIVSWNVFFVEGGTRPNSADQTSRPLNTSLPLPEAASASSSRAGPWTLWWTDPGEGARSCGHPSWETQEGINGWSANHIYPSAIKIPECFVWW